MPDLPHKSTLADHPDVRDLLPTFVTRLSTHIIRLQDLYTAGDLEALRHIAHQLRGAGKSYGFGPITAHAATLEELLIAGRPLAEMADPLNHLIAYIQNIEGYKPAPQPAIPPDVDIQKDGV